MTTPEAPAAHVDPNSLTFKDSSNVRSAVLDPASGVVEVTFANGAKYRYANFTHELMLDWSTAPSAGAWFNAIVKSNPDKHPIAGKEAAPKPAPKAAAPAPATQPETPKAKQPAAPVLPQRPAKRGPRTAKELLKLKPWRGIGNGCTTK